MRERPLLTILALVVASALCVVTVEVRIDRTGDPYYGFLVWNLFLAWVPFWLALAAFLRARRRIDVVTAALLVLWLLFFPNAPYLLTDFVHLGTSPAAPVWYDALMLSAFAWTALLLGFASLYLVQLVARRAAGRAWSWVVVVCALALASFGVYLGRFVRFNSWDALLRPGRVVDVIGSQLENPFEHPLMLVALVALTAFLLVGYGVLYGFASMRLELERGE
ncbi:MAG TPA: DUF1361 domain-containing protein [Gaiellaceae bacterium]|jgi:uncharacterized membrane protein|nr:DUF1361 domain-containing protein [Gaiellaceae bacterium]